MPKEIMINAKVLDQNSENALQFALTTGRADIIAVATTIDSPMVNETQRRGGIALRAQREPQPTLQTIARNQLWCVARLTTEHVWAEAEYFALWRCAGKQCVDL